MVYRISGGGVMRQPSGLPFLGPGRVKATPFLCSLLGGAVGIAVGAVVGGIIGTLFGASPLAFGGWGVDWEPILKGVWWGSICGAVVGSIPGWIGGTIGGLAGGLKRYALASVGGILGGAGVGALLFVAVTRAPDAMVFGAAIGQGIGVLAALAGAAVAGARRQHWTAAPAPKNGIRTC
jgi:hypothetical protein